MHTSTLTTKYLHNANTLATSLIYFLLLSEAKCFILNAGCNKHGSSISISNKLWVVPLQPQGPTTTVIEDENKNNNNIHEGNNVIIKDKLICQYCNEKFESRNELYRHLRNKDITCSRYFLPKDELKKQTTRHSMALLVGYDIFAQNNKDNGLQNKKQPSESESMHRIITKSFENIIRNNNVNVKVIDEEDDNDGDSKVMSVTQATAARHRHNILQQERGCASIGDVIVVNYLSDDSNSNPKNMSGIINSLNDAFNKSWSLCEGFTSSHTNKKDQGDITEKYIPPQVLAARLIAPKSKSTHLHAERLCTQRIYHYLLPIDWLPDCQSIKNWWSNSIKNDPNSDTISNAWYNKPSHQSHNAPPPKALRLFKQVLSYAMSPISNSSITSSSSSSSGGRFGLLSNRERRCFHNFADPSLQGSASPSQGMVWLALDRVRIGNLQNVKIDDNRNNDDVVAIIEFRGDGFLPEQIRRIVGTSVAIVNKWMPESFVDYALRSDIMIDTPIAPEGRLYFSEAKYHFEAMYHNGKSIFENEEWNVQREYAEQLYKSLLHRRALPENIKSEKHWLRNLQLEVAPKIIDKMNKAITASSSMSQDALINPNETNDIVVPYSYQHVLTLLRNLVVQQSWPTTSIARSRVLKENDIVNNLLSSSGSFTVINPICIPEFQQSSIPIPKNNALFPELAKAVFELEEQITLSSDNNLQRPLSTHCAINCNAQFLPHVDSGRGKGQSLSMIVGLGSYYHGGEILVEGIEHDIRYKPLEFDGWKQRHWTNPFRGERFSLVWFTPDS